eukprot:CAMPEP_0183833256 /NCGR_PEP_ID=MMETSP0807_2-20130328/5948_1 /TAXON_ID=88271 /ORGANISM="Picocystis salinarum, Strain CCMP1897" /LENGTH=1064 /DNA_ID=CAMNT_0026079157 /DNA_START=49 /DNA_END=3243 /DNA_ORIENTATION=+
MKRTRDEGNGPNATKRSHVHTSREEEALTERDALTYLREVKERFKDKKHVYESFLRIMKDFKVGRVDTAGVIVNVKALFEGHRELILGFNAFLPDGYEIELPPEEEEDRKGKQPVEFNQAINYVNKIKRRFWDNERVYKAFLEILNMYRKGLKSITQVYHEVAQLFQDHEDLLQEFTYFLPESAAPAAAKRKAQGTAKPTKKTEAPRSKTHQRKVQKPKQKEVPEPPPEETEEKKKQHSALQKELSFFEKVNQRLRNKEAYNDFIRCLSIFNQEVITRMELQGLVYDIIGKYPDLMQGFSEMMDRCEVMDFELEAKMAEKAGKMTPKDIAKMKAISVREKYLSRPIGELDLSQCERCTPSYRLLPRDYPRLLCSGRTALHHRVLNDAWVSVTSGSEDYSYQHMRRNQYEEALFRCEDDRFEMDMIIECNTATVMKVEELLEELNKMPEEERKAYPLPEGRLNPVHLRSIEKIYSEHGQEILELMAKHPFIVLPVVLNRLKQKDEEWSQLQKDMNVIWGNVYVLNYQKSLDHRSFYFKQADKKVLSTKGMINEIRELNEKRKQKDDSLVMLSASPQLSARLGAELECEVGDREIHDNIYAVIRCAAYENLSVDQTEKVLCFMRDFFEPFVGLPARDPEQYMRDNDRDTERGGRVEGAGKRSQAHSIEMETDEEPSKCTERKQGEDYFDDEADKSKKTSRSTESGRGEMEEEEDESVEDDPEKLFIASKPVSAQVPAVSQNDSDPEGKAKYNALFYANDAMYIFFRLHGHLYERLHTAKVSCSTIERKWKPGSERTEEDNDQPMQREDAEEIHAQFMSILLQLMEGTIEVGEYEDKCRELVGKKSYMLFTIEKLVVKLVKHLQVLLSEDVSNKLLLLHQYEKARSQPGMYTSQRDAVYHVNATMLLGDEACYRITCGDGVIGIQLMDPPSEKFDQPGTSMDAGFAEYLRTFLESTAGFTSAVSADGQSRPFLRRNMPLDCGREPEEDSYSKYMSGAVISNGLECKIACASSKVSYVLDTEDLFLKLSRKKHLNQQSKASNRRQQRYQEWLGKAAEKSAAATLTATG